MAKQLDTITFTSNYNNLQLFLSSFRFKFQNDEQANLLITGYDDKLLKDDKMTVIQDDSIGSKIVNLKLQSKNHKEVIKELSKEITDYELFCQQNTVLNIVMLVNENTKYEQGLSLLDKDLVLPNTSFVNLYIEKDVKIYQLVDDINKLIKSMGYELKKGA